MTGNSVTNGKLAVVTGGGTGLGRAIAERLVADGFGVVITGRDTDRLIAAARDLGEEVSIVSGDVALPAHAQDIARAVRARGEPLHVLVNNAGVMPMSRLSDPVEVLLDHWNRAIGVNLTGTMLVSHALTPLLAAPGGRIVNLSSIVARTGGSAPGFLAYTASKGGIDGLTLAMARELAGKGITVNAVAPGGMDGTSMTAELGAERRAAIAAGIPLGGLGRPQDIAGAVSYLAGVDGAYVTGQILQINGGWRFG